ncbi:unnamed protein product [Tenebrio molitor]|nr:unnamed protein product [Tenebrio molitor]
MECIVPGNNMKVLGKALQALSKIGDELYMEAKSDRLSLITLNSSKTVCARFHFFETFFSSYEVNPDDLSAAGNETITCKVHMKIFLPLFKGNLEKKLDYFKFEYTTDSDLIVFKMKYKCDDIVMVHKLRLMDNETLSIGVGADTGENSLGGSSSFYNQLLAMFSISDDELTFEITPAKVVARNYCQGTPCRPKMMRSHINLNSTEFLSYRITKETTVNFSLKPFRTVVHFAETFNLNIDLNFDVGGKPLSILLKNPTFEVNFIVATLNPYTDTNSSLATATSVAAGVTKARPTEISDEDLEAMQTENWESEEVTEEEKKDKENCGGPKKEEEDIVPRSPESPRSKKARTVFGRCYDPTFHETVLGEVLAANSDSE